MEVISLPAKPRRLSPPLCQLLLQHSNKDLLAWSKGITFAQLSLETLDDEVLILDPLVGPLLRFLKGAGFPDGRVQKRWNGRMGWSRRGRERRDRGRGDLRMEAELGWLS